jgi:transposase
MRLRSLRKAVGRKWAFAWLRRIRELYRLNRARMKQEPDSEAFGQADHALRDHVESMRLAREEELADALLRDPCRGALKSLQEHWTGLTLFVEDPRIPLDNRQRTSSNSYLGISRSNAARV